MDVLLRVNGELVPGGVDIAVLNVSRTGFAVISAARFRAGECLEFRLTAKNGPSVHVSAAAVYTRPLPNAAGLFVTGFTFRPGRITRTVPDVALVALIGAVAPEGFRY